jgi:hypothetical protein
MQGSDLPLPRHQHRADCRVEARDELPSSKIRAALDEIAITQRAILRTMRHAVRLPDHNKNAVRAHVRRAVKSVFSIASD